MNQRALEGREKALGKEDSNTLRSYALCTCYTSGSSMRMPHYSIREYSPDWIILLLKYVCTSTLYFNRYGSYRLQEARAMRL
jgi:hypothetical protein